LLVSLGALSDVPAATTARIHLRSALEGGGAGAGFVLHGGAPLPIAEVSDGDLSVRDVMDLGRWVSRAFEGFGEWNGTARLLSYQWSDNRTATAWRQGPIFYGALCADRSATARLIGHVSRCVDSGPSEGSEGA
jgi:hypothetical protein